MLNRAQFREQSPKKELMVWQFWAGRGIPGETRAYYRIYASAKTGKVTRAGFYREP